LKEVAEAAEKGSEEGREDAALGKEGANWLNQETLYNCSMWAYHLDFPLNNAPEVPSANLERLSSGQSPRLHIPAQLVKYRFLEVSKNSDRCQKVVQVIVVRRRAVPGIGQSMGHQWGELGSKGRWGWRRKCGLLQLCIACQVSIPDDKGRSDQTRYEEAEKRWEA